MIGDGVNFAARLETACDPFRIMIGSSTKSQLSSYSPTDPSIVKRYIKIKHHAELIEAYQVDPFYTSEKSAQEIEKLYWEFQGIERKNYRHPTQKEHLKLTCPAGTFTVRDFSEQGFGVEGSIFVARGVDLAVMIESESHIEEEIKDLLPLSIETKWGRISTSSKYLHGFKIVGPNPEQRQRLYETLKRTAAEEKLPA